MSAALGKRKRTVVPGGAIVKGKESAPAVQFGNAAQFREALRNEDADAVKGALTGFRSQIAVQLDDHPLPATDPKVKLVADFLERSPGAEDIFDAWDVAISTNSQALLPLPLAVLSAIIALLAPLSFFHPLLAPVLTRLLSPTIARSVTQYVTGSRSDLTIVALRVLVETARVGDRWAAKVWETVGAAHGGPQAKVWGKLFSMRRKDEKGQAAPANPFARPDIRTLAVALFTTLLTSGHLPTKVGILAQPSLIHGTSKLLASDHPAVVERVLQAWWEVWFKERRIPRVTKLPAFTPDVIGDILKVYVGADDDVSTKPDGAGYTAKELAHHFLRAFLTVPGKGVCYQDNGWYPRNFHLDATAEELLEEAGRRPAAGGVHNKVLKEVLKGAGTLGLVGEDKKAEELVVAILRSCPELVAGYWSGSGITLDPRLSSKFLISSAHLAAIVSLPVPVGCFALAPSLSSEPSSSAGAGAAQYRFVPPPLASVAENVLPAIFPRHYSTNGLQSRHALVRLTTATTLSRCLAKLWAVLDVFAHVARELEEGPQGQWTARRKELEREMRQRVPDVTTVVDFATAAARAAGSADADEAAQAAVLTEAALRLLSLYQATLPGLLAEEARFDVGKLLLPSAGAGAKGKGKEADPAAAAADDGWGFAKSSLDGVAALSQLHVLRLLGEGGDFTWGARAGASPHTYMYHLLNLYLTTPHAETRATTAALVAKLFGQSVLFEHDRREVATWLASLFASSRVAGVADAADAAKLQTLLPFLDDCLKRSLKTPYKYLEESLEFDAGGAPHHSEMPSPLFVALLEQLAAKIKAKLLAPAEVEVVAAFVGGLALGLAAKQRSLGHAAEAARRIDLALEAAGLGGTALKGQLERDLQALAASRVVAAEQAAALAEQASRDKALLVANADLREISTWSRLGGADLRQPLQVLIASQSSTDDAANAAAADIPDAMQSLVRLLADSKDMDYTTLTAVKALKSSVEAQPPTLNAGLVEPLFTVILEDHASSEIALELVCAMAPRTVMKPAIVVRNLQTLLATRTFATLSRASPLRTPILLVIRALFDMSPATCCQPVHIEPLIPVYAGSMDVADRTLLSILHLFERHRRISVATLLATWSPEGPDAAGAIRRALDILFALDPRRMLASCADFPQRRSLDLQTEVAAAQAYPAGDEVYDPVYILSVFAMALAQGLLGGGYELSALDWVEVLRSNVLGLAACALSSRQADMRELGSFVLAKSFAIIKETDFQEQTQVLYTLYLLRHACPPPEAPSRTPRRAPTVITLFFAHTLRAIGTPSSFLYPATSRFLLQRAKIDVGDVPLLYGMLYSSDDEWKQERGWMIRFVRDGMQSAQDWRILQRRHTFSLFISLYQSTQDAIAQRSIVEAIANMTRNATACAALVRREGLLPWLAIQLGATGAGAGDDAAVNDADAQAAAVDDAAAKQIDPEVVWLRLAENAVVFAGQEDVARVARKPDAGLKAAWRGEVLGLLLKAIQSSSRLQVLHTAARILLRLALLPSTSVDVTPSPATVLAAIFTSLRAVEPSLARAAAPSTDAAASGLLWSAKDVFAPISLSAEQAWSDITANLWRSALALGSDVARGGVATETMEGLSGRVVAGGGPLARWVAGELKVVLASEAL